jgi:hypothetical protein
MEIWKSITGYDNLYIYIVRDISGEIIAEYSSISQASIALNMDKSNISKCCRGVMCSYKSLTFSYK